MYLSTKKVSPLMRKGRLNEDMEVNIRLEEATVRMAQACGRREASGIQNTAYGPKRTKAAQSGPGKRNVLACGCV